MLRHAPPDPLDPAVLPLPFPDLLFRHLLPALLPRRPASAQPPRQRAVAAHADSRHPLVRPAGDTGTRRPRRRGEQAAGETRRRPRAGACWVVSSRTKWRDGVPLVAKANGLVGASIGRTTRRPHGRSCRRSPSLSRHTFRDRSMQRASSRSCSCLRRLLRHLRLRPSSCSSEARKNA